MTEVFDNPFDQDKDSLQNETPPPDKVITDAIHAILYELHTSMPAQITKVVGNSRINVQPLLKRRLKTGDVFLLPEIQDVAVAHPRGKNYWIRLPVAVGDVGNLHFAERSLDKWLVSGGQIDPADPRKHHIADAVFYPGLYPFSDQVQGSADDMVLHNGAAELVLQSAGKFKLKNSAQELLNNLSTLVQTLSTASTVAGGPFVPSVVTALNQIQTNIDSLKGT